MATDKIKQHKVHTIPPHDLVVQKFAESRAPELDSLYSTIATRSNNNFKSQRNKRRRTTSHDNQSSKTRFRKKQKLGVFLNKNSDVNSVKKSPPRHIRRKKELNENPKNEFCTSGNGTKRLRTHVWHAKRFTMTTRWGFHLPLGLHGSGRGSRALLKCLNNGTVVHDASYYSAVQLEGLQDSILSILSTVMSPLPSSDAENVLSGGIYATCMLHHAGQPNLGTIAPVMYMWRLNQKSTDADSELNGSEDHVKVKVKNGPSFRQLWIWIHAAALTEGYNALKSACESQGKVTGDVDSVKCTSLEGQFGTLEVMGVKASHLLQKILKPVIRDTSSTTAFNMENEDDKSCSEIIPLVVNDPRALTLTNNTEFDFDSICTELWDVSKGHFYPVQENVLCMEKHHERLLSFCLTTKTSNDDNTPTKIGSSRFCPILLLKRNNIKDSITRWTIIVPLTWVKAFWVPLISNGAQAIGIRERSWVASEAGIPNFPSEFPECNSYSSLMEAEASIKDEEASLRPESVRPFDIPILPPWNCVRLAFRSKSNPSEPEGPEPEESNMVVARSARMLTGFLNAINGDRLLLFPHEKNTSISKTIRDDKILDQVPNIATFVENGIRRKVCFVRVVLCSYKEGVIEDGAVVCAPRTDDIKLWTSGLNNKVELQVPQSLLATYFAKQDSGKWEFKAPQDMESNRWPIGFVTSGFVHGSKKQLAEGLCDAVLLANLRHQQWGCVPVNKRKKEVFVLTRNIRSTAYRLALASIVLEHQEEDLHHF